MRRSRWSSQRAMTPFIFPWCPRTEVAPQRDSAGCRGVNGPFPQPLWMKARVWRAYQRPPVGLIPAPASPRCRPGFGLVSFVTDRAAGGGVSVDRGRSAAVLLVDDDRDLVDLLAFLVTQAGFRSLT